MGVENEMGLAPPAIPSAGPYLPLGGLRTWLPDSEAVRKLFPGADPMRYLLLVFLLVVVATTSPAQQLNPPRTPGSCLCPTPIEPLVEKCPCTSSVLQPNPNKKNGILRLGYYCGPAIAYPYDPVYCVTDNCGGGCYGLLLSVPRSALLPAYEKYCEWADLESTDLSRNWYQWEPRTVAPDQQKYLGVRICYLDDKGSPKTLQEFKRDFSK